MANTLNRYCAMALLREVFINLSLEIDRSAVATVTGMVRYFSLRFLEPLFSLQNIAMVWLSF